MCQSGGTEAPTFIQPLFSLLHIAMHISISVVTPPAEKAKGSVIHEERSSFAGGFSHNGSSIGFALFAPVSKTEAERPPGAAQFVNFVSLVWLIEYAAICNFLELQEN